MIYRLNLISDRVKPLVMVSQFDTLRKVEFEIYNGEELYSPVSATILIGTNQYQGTISNGIVSFTVPSSLTQNAQSLFGEVVVSDGGQMGTCNFLFKVDSTPVAEGARTLSLNRPSIGLKPIMTPMVEPIEEPVEDEEENDEELLEETEEPTEEEEDADNDSE